MRSISAAARGATPGPRASASRCALGSSRRSSALPLFAPASVIICALAAAAHADPDDLDNVPQPVARPAHGSIGVGGALDFGSTSRTAAVAALDYLPGGEFGTWGVTLGVRDVGWSPFARHGSATLGVIREAAAARPLLAVLVHGDVGVAWRDGASTLPLAGGGLKTYLKLKGSFGIALDTTLDLQIDGVDGTHLVLGFALSAAAIR